MQAGNGNGSLLRMTKIPGSTENIEKSVLGVAVGYEQGSVRDFLVDLRCPSCSRVGFNRHS